jgi:hypothetical protein
MRTTKRSQVKEYLKKRKVITSWEAIEKFGATRLADIIYDLRKSGWKIATTSITMKDRNGNNCTYAKYILNE